MSFATTLLSQLLHEARDLESHLVVLEDDALPSTDGAFQAFLAQAWHELPKDYDIFYLWIHPKFRDDARKRDGDKKASELFKEHLFVAKGLPQYGMVGYMVSQAGRRKILQRIKDIGACTGLCGNKYAPAIDRVLQAMIKNDKGVHWPSCTEICACGKIVT